MLRSYQRSLRSWLFTHYSCLAPAAWTTLHLGCLPSSRQASGLEMLDIKKRPTIVTEILTLLSNSIMPRILYEWRLVNS